MVLCMCAVGWLLSLPVGVGELGELLCCVAVCSR